MTKHKSTDVASAEVLTSSSNVQGSVRRSLAYMPQLDGLRTLAVLCVLATHWIDAPWVRTLDPGRHGVRLFFVLSGFLITRILLSYRDELLNDPSANIGKYLRRFYAHRSLRIFPLYYCLLLAAVLINSPGMREVAPWHALYLSNLRLAIEGKPIAGTLFWSLAVEEQFYLVWPLLVLCIRPQRLFSIILILVTLAPLYRLTGHLLSWNSNAIRWLPFGCLDTLGMGALLGYMWHIYGPDSQKTREFIGSCLIVGVPLAIVGAMFDNPSHLGASEWGITVSDLADACLFSGLVYSAARGISGTLGRVLLNPVIAYLGTLSYGIYVLHPFVKGVISRYELDVFIPEPLRPGLWLLATVAAASLSWFLLERPAVSLKRYLKK